MKDGKARNVDIWWIGLNEVRLWARLGSKASL